MLEIIDNEREVIVDLVTKHDFLEMEEFNARTN